MATAVQWKEDAHRTPAIAYLLAVAVSLAAALGQLWTVRCVVLAGSVAQNDAKENLVPAIFTSQMADIFVAVLWIAAVLLVAFTCMSMSRHLKRPSAADLAPSPAFPFI